jgi:MSHA biogenesis protein MshM
MYLNHFGLNEAPFRITPHTEFFFSGANRGATLDALLYAIAHDEGIVKVTGEVGSGKTMLGRVLLERLPKNVVTIYLANPSLSRDEILHVIAADLKIDARAERVTILLRALQERLIKLYAAGRRVVVLIDEAHAMPLETLEEVRLLSNLESNRHKLLQIVLFGQPELDEHLALPKMRQLKERITHSFRLGPLERSEVESYVDFRMRAAGYRGPNVFAPRSMKLISRASAGLTRRVNILSDKSLLAAFADGTHQVAPKHARAAIRDSEFGESRRGGSRRWLLGAGIAAGLAIGVGAHLMGRLGGTSAEAPAISSSINNSASRTESPTATSPTSEEGLGSHAPLTPSAQVAARSQSSFPSAHARSSGERLAKEDAAVAAGTTSAVQSQASPGSQVADAPRRPRPPLVGKLAQERFAATQTWLDTAPAGAYSIQLLTVADADAGTLERFLRQASEVTNPGSLFVYSAKINGEQHYSVAYGVYPNVEETITAMGDLPKSLKARGPTHRSLTAIRRQNQE